MAVHHFETTLRWTGNDGRGTGPRDFARHGELDAADRPTVPTLPPPAFAGGEGGWSPEHLLVGAVSQCHMLWYLHLCQRNGVVVEDYVDHASGELEVARAEGRMASVTLRAEVRISAGDPEVARDLFATAGELCYITRSLNCPVELHVQVSGP
ncbi:MAG: OsmC family protein [Microthrixaceae bacterium]